MATQTQSLGTTPVRQTTRYRRRLNLTFFDLIPYLLFIALLVIIFASNPRLIVNQNTGAVNWRFFEIKSNAAFTLILATVGETLVLFTGGIDLSIGGVLSLTNSLAATQMTDDPGSVVLWTVIILGIGVGAGLLNGFVVTVMRVTPFIATLATWSIFKGLALLVLSDPGGTAAEPLKDFVRGDQLGIPNSILFTLLIIVVWLLFKRSRWGTRLYAIGSSESHAYFNGTAVQRTKLMAYVGSGLFAALAGLYRTVEISKGSPIAGDPFILQAVAAALVGGIALSGGRGNLISAIIGAYIMLFINDVIQFMGVSSFYTPMVQGLFLIVAVFLNAVGHRIKLRRALAQ